MQAFSRLLIFLFLLIISLPKLLIAQITDCDQNSVDDVCDYNPDITTNPTCFATPNVAGSDTCAGAQELQIGKWNQGNTTSFNLDPFTQVYGSNFGSCTFSETNGAAASKSVWYKVTVQGDPTTTPGVFTKSIQYSTKGSRDLVGGIDTLVSLYSRCPLNSGDLSSQTLCSNDNFCIGPDSLSRLNSGGSGEFETFYIRVSSRSGESGPFQIMVNSDGISECNDDCDANSVLDSCQRSGNQLADCNGNFRLDSCEIADCGGGAECDDCNENGYFDSCDLDPSQGGTSIDCNENSDPDECDIALAADELGLDMDQNSNGFIDFCEDCNNNDTADFCEFNQVAVLANFLDDEGTLISNPFLCTDVCIDNPDCGNGDDVNSNSLLDTCESDCNANDIPDEHDLTTGNSLDCNLNSKPDECDVTPAFVMTGKSKIVPGLVNECGNSLVLLYNNVGGLGESVVGPLDTGAKDIDVDPVTGSIHTTGCSDFGFGQASYFNNQGLFTVDPLTGLATKLPAELNVFPDFPPIGLTFGTDGRLFGIDSDGDNENPFKEFDPIDGSILIGGFRTNPPDFTIFNSGFAMATAPSGEVYSLSSFPIAGSPAVGDCIAGYVTPHSLSGGEDLLGMPSENSSIPVFDTQGFNAGNCRALRDIAFDENGGLFGITEEADAGFSSLTEDHDLVQLVAQGGGTSYELDTVGSLNNAGSGLGSSYIGSANCNNDAVPDECQDDCDNDGIPDDCEADSDNDGVPNDCEECPNDALKLVPGVCGCGLADIDSDNDGTLNCLDQCPNDQSKTSAGVCGCGVADIDSDADGTLNCLDLCPNDKLKTAPGVCGCGVEDLDLNENDIVDCLFNDELNALVLSIRKLVKKLKKISSRSGKKKKQAQNRIKKQIKALVNQTKQYVETNVAQLTLSNTTDDPNNVWNKTSKSVKKALKNKAKAFAKNKKKALKELRKFSNLL